MAMNYVVTARVKELMKMHGMRMSGDTADALNRMVEEALKKAVGRAKANGRKTVKAEDL
jgi:histone H3/H4